MASTVEYIFGIDILDACTINDQKVQRQFSCSGRDASGEY